MTGRVTSLLDAGREVCVVLGCLAWDADVGSTSGWTISIMGGSVLEVEFSGNLDGISCAAIARVFGLKIFW